MSILRQDSSRSNSVASEDPAPSAGKGSTLRKNQACHQCRKQKRKCDAHRPCKSCVRAHANVIANAVKRGKPFPARPECVYDGDSPASYDPNETVDLNERNELASKILSTSQSPTPAQARQTPVLLTETLQSNEANQSITDALFAQFDQSNPTNPSSLMQSIWATSPVPDPLEDIGNYGFVRPKAEPAGPPEMLLDLPPLDLVHSLMDVFFENWVFARQMIHMPTFKKRVRLAPSDPNFPSVALLHAICALGAVYLPQPGVPAEEIKPGEEPARGHIFRTDEQVSRVLGGMASFGEHQTMLAQIKAINDARTGKRLVESLQAIVCICWWYVIHTRWVDLWIVSGTAIRLSIPLGLSGARGYDEILWGPNFGDPSFPNFKETVLPPPSDFVESETRKRTFWMAFLTDRLHSTANAWPTALDELDIGQSFPYPLEYFEAGIPPGPDAPSPQKLSTPDMLNQHHPQLTDDGILLLKAVELLSRITVFNNRVRTRYNDPVNVATSPAFKMLDENISSFIQSLSKEYQNVFAPGGLRTLRPASYTIPHCARILLHDPHCKLDDPTNPSTQACLVASREILNATYQLQSLSIPFKLLPPTLVFVWSMAGKSLLRNYVQSLKATDYPNALIYREEIRFLYHSIFRLGENLPIGIRHGLLLQELLNRVDKLYPLPDGCAWPSPMI